MIRVVLDTNILVSALLTPQGLPAKVLSLCVTDRDLQIVLSADIYAEYEEVIRRPKFKRSDFEINAILLSIRESAAWIRPSATVRVCPDPDDDIFLECAQAADANYLVTGNTKHFPAAWERTQVVTVRQFIDALA
jgi:putative PIN family toxin of toxin-antitoxin system